MTLVSIESTIIRTGLLNEFTNTIPLETTRFCLFCLFGIFRSTQEYTLMETSPLPVTVTYTLNGIHGH